MPRWKIEIVVDTADGLSAVIGACVKDEQHGIHITGTTLITDEEIVAPKKKRKRSKTSNGISKEMEELIEYLIKAKVSKISLDTVREWCAKTQHYNASSASWILAILTDNHRLERHGNRRNGYWTIAKA